jgi:uncharacterized membrane protein (Fun14 family)
VDRDFGMFSALSTTPVHRTIGLGIIIGFIVASIAFCLLVFFVGVFVLGNLEILAKYSAVPLIVVGLTWWLTSGNGWGWLLIGVGLFFLPFSIQSWFKI